MATSRRLVGDTLFRALVKPTMYDQFVGGDSAQQLEKTVAKLEAANVRLMLAVMLESDVGEGGRDELEVVLDKNMESYLEIIPAAGAMGTSRRRPMCQLKGSGLVQSEHLVNSMNLMISGSEHICHCGNTVPPITYYWTVP